MPLKKIRKLRGSIPTREQFSAGGVAYRESESGIEIAIVLILPKRHWQLPKGIIDPGETIEQTALREVSEEAGIECNLIAPIETIEYWFKSNRDGVLIRIHKFVHLFLMKYISGDVADHDHEVAEARWEEINEAHEMLFFKNEKAVVMRAMEMIPADTSNI